MAIRWEALTIDAREPESLARWWAKTLGWVLVDPQPGGVEVRSPDGHSSSLFFVRVDDAKLSKNRLHLDLYAEDQVAAVDDLISRGATRAAVGQPDDAEWVVLRDPEGNEFCLLEPR
ncbi:VOC family protein [Qaidamihabitans albus]|uniref:VOC family protein n=1 Tax=Qaidamihabitans albus TaxID=2795733 RepID=UPI0018F21B32|nr:VOC family protein [Qaidamihabitans albus]